MGAFFWYTNLCTQPAISFRLNKVRRSVCEVRHHVPQIEESMEIAKVEKWDFGKGLMTLDKIREMFTPAAHFRITRSEYPAGAEFSEASREGACYVLQGNVTYRLEKFSFENTHSAGEFANLPSGSYLVSMGRNEAVSLVRVWELPAEFWPN